MEQVKIIQFKHTISSLLFIHLVVLGITNTLIVVEAQVQLSSRAVKDSQLRGRSVRDSQLTSIPNKDSHSTSRSRRDSQLTRMSGRDSISQPEVANGRLLPIIGFQDFHIERPHLHQRPEKLSDFEEHFSKNDGSSPRIHGIEKIISDQEKRFIATQEENHRVNAFSDNSHLDGHRNILVSSREISDHPYGSPEDRSVPKFGIPKSMGHLFNRQAGGGCDSSDGFHMGGDVWYSRGCRRHKCINFRGDSFIETDQCDTEIYNTVYKCIIEVDLQANFPHCCPRYKCNPDNLGNKVPDKQGETQSFSTRFNVFV